MYKVCTNGKCKHGNEPQVMKNFSRRSGKARFLEDGSPSYMSQCKSCGVTQQNERIKMKRAAVRAKRESNFCVDCGEKVSHYAKRCTLCASLDKNKNTRGMGKTKSTIKPYFLEPRGSKARKEMGLPPVIFSDKIYD